MPSRPVIEVSFCHIFHKGDIGDFLFALVICAQALNQQSRINRLTKSFCVHIKRPDVVFLCVKGKPIDISLRIKRTHDFAGQCQLL